MVDGVHSHTPGLRPAVALSTHSVVLAARLEEGLVDTATTGGNTDGCASAGRDGLLGARGETDASLAVLVVANDGGIVARGTGNSSTVTDLLLDVEENGTLGARAEGEDVADGESGLLAGVDERAGRDALGRDKGLLAELVAVGVTEDDGGKGSATKELAFPSTGLCALHHPRAAKRCKARCKARGSPAQSISISSLCPSTLPYLRCRDARCPHPHSPASVVDNLTNNATDVTVLLRKVEVAETSRVLVVVGVRLEDATRLPLGTNNALPDQQNPTATDDAKPTPIVCAVSNVPVVYLFVRTTFLDLTVE